jgi:hypothetical protein
MKPHREAGSSPTILWVGTIGGCGVQWVSCNSFRVAEDLFTRYALARVRSLTRVLRKDR